MYLKGMSGQGKSGQVMARQFKSGLVMSEQVKSIHVKSSWDWSSQVGTGLLESGSIKSDQDRAS